MVRKTKTVVLQAAVENIKTLRLVFGRVLHHHRQLQEEYLNLLNENERLRKSQGSQTRMGNSSPQIDLLRLPPNMLDMSFMYNEDLNNSIIIPNIGSFPPTPTSIHHLFPNNGRGSLSGCNSPLNAIPLSSFGLPTPNLSNISTTPFPGMLHNESNITLALSSMGGDQLEASINEDHHHGVKRQADFFCLN